MLDFHLNIASKFFFKSHHCHISIFLKRKIKKNCIIVAVKKKKKEIPTPSPRSSLHNCKNLPFFCMSTSVLGLCYCWSFAPVGSWRRLRLPEEEGKNATGRWAGQRRWSTLSRSSFSPIPTESRTPYRWPGSSQGQLCCLQLPPRRSPPRSLAFGGVGTQLRFPGEHERVEGNGNYQLFIWQQNLNGISWDE